MTIQRSATPTTRPRATPIADTTSIPEHVIHDDAKTLHKQSLIAATKKRHLLQYCERVAKDKCYLFTGTKYKSDYKIYQPPSSPETTIRIQ